MNDTDYTNYTFGNVFTTQILVTTIAGILITSFSSLINNLISQIINTISNINFDFFKRKYKSSVTVSSISFENCHGISNKSSENYRVIIYKLYKLGINIEKIKEHNVAYNVYGEYDERTKSGIYNYDIDTKKEIIMVPEKDIRLKPTFSEKNREGNGNNNSLSYTISFRNMDLYSTKLTVNELIDELNKWKIEYNDFVKQYNNDGKLYYFSLLQYKQKNKRSGENNNKEDEMNDINKDKWRANQFQSFKTFDNIFFTDKEFLLNKFNYFMNNEEVYKKKGIPYNFGLLFHGLPGCGKTSCIKAIANLMKRHVIEISLNKIKTCGEFINILTNEFIDDKYIPIDKRIILIEDIDCMLDIVIDRKIKSEEDDNQKQLFSKMTVDEIFKMKLMTTDSTISFRDMYKNEDKLTLACILNTIDGVLEQHGRILIITSNYADKLDAALIRPGRIDVKINFTKCTNKMMREIIEFFYQTNLPPHITFPDNKYTPAELINKCVSSGNTMKDVVDEFRS